MILKVFIPKLLIVYVEDIAGVWMWRTFSVSLQFSQGPDKSFETFKALVMLAVEENFLGIDEQSGDAVNDDSDTYMRETSIYSL